MKVLQINSVCGYGSTGRIVTDIYESLKEQGHDCFIAYGRGNASKGMSTIKIGTNVDNYVHLANTRLFGKHGFASVNATKEFLEKVKNYDPDVIHLHNIHGYYINIELLFNYLKEANKPVVWTLHDCWSFTGHCAYFEYADCKKWKEKCCNCPQKKAYPQSIFIDNSKYNYIKKKKIFNGVKNMIVITPSKWLAYLVNESFLKNYEVRVINNGIDLDVFRQKDRNIFRKKYNLEDKFLILGVANIWEERKGFQYFLELSNRIDNNSRIILIGLNDKQLKQLPQNVIGMKRTNNVEELVEIYSAADVYVNPTLEDNFPTTNLEALACGTPVITFDTGGSIECIDEKCGVVVPKGDKDKLFQTLQILRKNNLEEMECINRSRLFDKNDRYKDYINLYRNALSAK